MSFDHQDRDLALKSPILTVKEDLSILTWFDSLSKLIENSSNSLLDWLGDLDMTVTYNLLYFERLFHKQCTV